MKKLFAIVFAVVLCFALGTVAWAAEVIGTGAHNDHTEWAEFTAINDSVAAGQYYLSDTLPTIGGNIVIGDGTTATAVTLCLNGKNLNLGSYKIEVKAEATLTVCDCQSTQGTAASTVTVIDNKGTVNIEGGLIKAENPEGSYEVAERHGINNSGTLNITGGTVQAESPNFTGEKMILMP